MSDKKEIQVKLQIAAGKATPAPPVGTVLGPQGINLMEFCKQFNAKTQSMGDSVIPVIISIDKKRNFTFVIKKPPVSDLIKKALSIKKGSSIPNRDKVGELTEEQLVKIAKEKMEDLNAYNIEAAKSIVLGTARSMGVVIKN